MADSSGAGRTLFQSATRLTFSGAVFLVLTLLGLVAVHDQFAEHTLAFDARLVSPAMVGSLAALMVVYLAADGLRLYFVLRALGETIAPGRMLRLVFINIFVSNITPLATGGGLAQIWYMQRSGIGVGRAAAATTIRTVLAIIVIFALAPVFMLVLPELGAHPLLRSVSAVLAVLMGVYLCLFGVVLFRARWLIAPLSALVHIAGRLRLIGRERRLRLLELVEVELLVFSRSFRAYLRGPRRFVILSMICTLVFLFSLFSFPTVIMTNLGYDVDLLTGIGKLVVITFIMYFSPTPGAAGISEGVFAGLFAAQVSADHLILVILAWRFVTIYFGMLVGLAVTQREVTRDRRAP